MSQTTTALVPPPPAASQAPAALAAPRRRRFVETLARGVFHIETYPFNWYVLEEQGRLTLVDSGWPGHLPALQDGLAQIGRGLRDIEAIVLTHAHSDHVGMAGLLSRRYRIPVFVHEGDRVMAGRVLQLPWYGLLSNGWRHHMAFHMLGHAITHGLLAERGITDTKALVDSAVVPVPGRPRVVHVPGHTPGEVCLLLEDRGVLLSGDTVVTENMLTGRPGGPQFPHVHLNGKDPVALRSADKLADLGHVRLLPGHGRPWEGEMREAIAMAHEARTR